MKKATAFLLIVALLVISHLLPYGFSQQYSQTYQLLNEPDGSTYYRLNVTAQQSLYDYYVEKTHKLNSNTDFAKFVTPYALQPIANSLATIYTDDEDFTNGVLMIVHQIPYEATGPVKYPVETIVENKGDCDLFSYIAASIIKAYGLDVVLLYYETQAHMNIGVRLSHQPYDAREAAYYVTYNDVRYYVAETTGGDWQNGWRVGECPSKLKNAQVQVITLENSEQWAPGQVSASYNTLASSTLSLTISPTYLIQGSTVTLSGQLTPILQNVTITIYIKVNYSPWIALDTVTTNNEGHFTYIWNTDVAGLCYVRASWSGNDLYAGADSPIQAVTVLSMFFILLLTMTAILVGAGIAIFLTSRQNQPQIPEPQPPEVPMA
ncbi:Ig-like domain repeat protein [Candidatus Bathyarchaeota archaeon]|nr:Ig-like domain repeat protein [Candidatus Bathyarchaeota archaeon]